MAELPSDVRAAAGIDIGAVKAAQNAIISDLEAEGGIKIESVTAKEGDAQITGLRAGRASAKK